MRHRGEGEFGRGVESVWLGHVMCKYEYVMLWESVLFFTQDVDVKSAMGNVTFIKIDYSFSLVKIVVVKPEGPPKLCKTDEVGELCVASGTVGSAYFGLVGKTNHTFKVQAIVYKPYSRRVHECLQVD